MAYIQKLFGIKNYNNMKDLFHSSKKFLNKDGHESDASIFTEIKFIRNSDSYADCTLKIKDCNHQIFLVIEVTDYDEKRDEGEFENSLFKIDTLIEELTNFREQCVKANQESHKRRLLAEKEREEKKDEMDSGNNSTNSGSDISDPAGTPVIRLGTVR